MKCARENSNEDRLVAVNSELQSGNEILEKAVAEVIKTKDSDNHTQEHMQHKHGKK